MRMMAFYRHSKKDACNSKEGPHQNPATWYPDLRLPSLAVLRREGRGGDFKVCMPALEGDLRLFPCVTTLPGVRGLGSLRASVAAEKDG